MDVGGPAGVVDVPAAGVAAEGGVGWRGLGAGGGELLDLVEELVEFGVELRELLLDLDCPFGGFGRHFGTFDCSGQWRWLLGLVGMRRGGAWGGSF